MQIIKYDKSCLEILAKLFSQDYQRLFDNNPLLPEKYLNYENVLPYVKWITEKYPCVIAVDNDQVVGYLSGILIPEFKCSNTGVYTPEWAHFSKDISIYDNLFKEIAIEWNKNHYTNHCITILSHNKDFINSLFLKGY